MNLTELTQECTEALRTLGQFDRILRDYERAHKMLDRIGVPRITDGALSLGGRISELGMWIQGQGHALPVDLRVGMPLPPNLGDSMCMSKEQAQGLLDYLGSGTAGYYNSVKRDEALAIIRRIAERETPE